jgi:hypothetical protein
MVILENGTRYGKHEHEYEWVVYHGTGVKLGAVWVNLDEVRERIA